VKSGDKITLEGSEWHSVYEMENENQSEEGLKNQLEEELKTENIRQIFNFAYEKYLMETETDQISLIGVLPEVENVVDSQNVNLVSQGIFYQHEDGE
jgi:vacuolar-type H+-ATPase subunit C/Vma6